MEKKEVSDKRMSSHSTALKSTSIVGGSQFVGILISIVRTKIIAVLIGPSGVGLIGVFQGIIDLLRNATGFGISFSCVKSIAEASGRNDNQSISKAITILRRWVWATGILGMIIGILACEILSRYSFGDGSFTVSIALISCVLLFNSLQEGQLGLLQGLRLINKMAKARILSSLLGLLVTVPIYWFWGIEGIVPALIVNSIVMLIVSNYFAGKVSWEKSAMSLRQSFSGGLSMAKLGFFIVISGFGMSATMYVTRYFLVSHGGMDTVGMFQAAWNVSNIYVGLILNSMLADFFPRLTQVNQDNELLRKYTNEQCETTFLLGGPMISVILVVLPVVISILYSSEFHDCIRILDWQLAAEFITFMTWPLGVIFLAKGHGHYCVLTDFIWFAIYLLTVFIGWGKWGVEILGIAVLISNIVKHFVVYLIVRQCYNFSWSRQSIKLILINGACSIACFTILRFVPGDLKYFFAGIVCLALCCFSIIELNKLIDLKDIIKKKIFRKA